MYRFTIQRFDAGLWRVIDTEQPRCRLFNPSQPMSEEDARATCAWMNERWNDGRL